MNMKKIHTVLSVLALSASGFLSCSAAEAQGLRFSEDQKLIFEADQQVVKKDYKGAEGLYSEAIALNKNNIDAYLHRGTVRHELGDSGGVASDGQATVTLANTGLQNTPNDPNLYYKRGMGFRLLKNYDQAEKDISTGMRLGGQPTWQTDLQAIAFEKKAAK
jgi:tetratricopeptide (TPR) repeat protein